MSMPKEELENLEWKEDNDDVNKLEAFEVGMIRSLNNYFKHLKVKWNLPFNLRDLQCNTISIEDRVEFMCDPDILKLLESTGDVNSCPPPGLFR